MTTVDPQNLVYAKFPLEWIEARDFERLTFDRSTWIPLVLEEDDILHGRFGTSGYRKGYRDFDSIIVPLDLKTDFERVDWQSVSRFNSDGAWADDEAFYPSKEMEPPPRTRSWAQVDAARRFLDCSRGR